TELMPALLASLARTADPDTAFARFDRFLGNLPAGVQVLSLFYQNPELLDVVLAQPSGLIGRTRLAQDLAAVLAQARDLEDVLDLVRRFAGDHGFRIGVAMLRGLVPVEQATAE